MLLNAVIHFVSDRCTYNVLYDEARFFRVVAELHGAVRDRGDPAVQASSRTPSRTIRSRRATSAAT